MPKVKVKGKVKGFAYTKKGKAAAKKAKRTAMYHASAGRLRLD